MSDECWRKSDDQNEKSESDTKTSGVKESNAEDSDTRTSSHVRKDEWRTQSSSANSSSNNRENWKQSSSSNRIDTRRSPPGESKRNYTLSSSG